MEVANLLIRIGADGKNLSSGINKSIGSLKGLYGALAGGTAAAFSKALLDAASEYEDMHKKTGLAVETLQKWNSALKKGGATIDDAVIATTFLQKAIAAAADGGKEAEHAFSVLGVSMQDLKTKSYDQIFMQIAKAIEEMPNDSRVTAAALAVLGKGGQNLFAAFREGFQDNVNNARALRAEFVLLGKEMEESGKKMKGWMKWAGSEAILGGRTVGLSLWDQVKAIGKGVFAFTDTVVKGFAPQNWEKSGGGGAGKRAFWEAYQSVWNDRMWSEYQRQLKISELNQTYTKPVTPGEAPSQLAPEAPNDPNWKPTITPYNAIPTSPLSSDAFTKIGLFTGARGDGVKAIAQRQLEKTGEIVSEVRGLRVDLTVRDY